MSNPAMLNGQTKANALGDNGYFKTVLPWVGKGRLTASTQFHEKMVALTDALVVLGVVTRRDSEIHAETGHPLRTVQEIIANCADAKLEKELKGIVKNKEQVFQAMFIDAITVFVVRYFHNYPEGKAPVGGSLYDAVDKFRSQREFFAGYCQGKRADCKYFNSSDAKKAKASEKAMKELEGIARKLQRKEPFVHALVSYEIEKAQENGLEPESSRTVKASAAAQC